MKKTKVIKISKKARKKFVTEHTIHFSLEDNSQKIFNFLKVGCQMRVYFAYILSSLNFIHKTILYTDPIIIYFRS